MKSEFSNAIMKIHDIYQYIMNFQMLFGFPNICFVFYRPQKTGIGCRIICASFSTDHKKQELAVE